MVSAHGRIVFRYESVRIIAVLYCSFPIVLFLLFWLKPAIGLLAATSLALSVFLAFQHLKPGQDNVLFKSPFENCTNCNKSAALERAIALKWQWVVALAIVVVAWCILGGQGGFWYQSGDWDSRNALFRDLITHQWPVRYQSDGSWLCYYVGHWLPSAAAGKILLRLGIGLPVVWKTANVGLLLWTACGVYLVLLLALITVSPGSLKQRVACIVVFVFFSTPDLLGMLITGSFDKPLESLHLEWWAINMQFSSLTTCLFWVFNQTVIPWICTLLFLNERSSSMYLLILAGCVFAGPLPSIGLGLFMACQGIAALFRGRGLRFNMLRSLASATNFFALPAIICIVLFFLSSSAVGDEAIAKWSQQNLLLAPLYLPSEQRDLLLALMFVLLEGLLIPLLLRCAGFRGALLVSTMLILFISPFIRFNLTADFCMRVSIPAILVLCVLCMKATTMLLDKGPDRFRFGDVSALRWKVSTTALVIVLLIGAATSVMEFYRGFDSVARIGIEASVNDPFVTFEGRDGWPRTNFVVKPDENAIPMFSSIAQNSDS